MARGQCRKDACIHTITSFRGVTLPAKRSRHAQQPQTTQQLKNKDNLYPATTETTTETERIQREQVARKAEEEKQTSLIPLQQSSPLLTHGDYMNIRSSAGHKYDNLFKCQSCKQMNVVSSTVTTSCKRCKHSVMTKYMQERSSKTWLQAR